MRSGDRIAELNRQKPWFGWTSDNPAPPWAQKIINAWIQEGTVPGYAPDKANIGDLRNYLASKLKT